MRLKLVRFFIFIIVFTTFLTGCAGTNTKGLHIAGDGIMKSSSSPLVWQQHRSQLFTSAEDASNYVKNLQLGGFSDWRLPTSEELLDFYFDFDFGGANAEKLGIRAEGSYWFKNNSDSPQTGAWKDDGDICEITRGYRRSSSGYVRAVRP